MLNSERTIKIKIRLRWTVFEILLTPLNSLKLFEFKEFCMETRLSNIFKTTDVTKLTKGIQRNSYKVLQVTSQ